VNELSVLSGVPTNGLNELSGGGNGACVMNALPPSGTNPPRLALRVRRRVLRRECFRAISYILTKTMWVWLLIGVAVLVILFYRSTREHLKNRNEQPIYGPTALPPIIDGTSAGGAKHGKTTGGPYPDIFGPDATPQIGAGSLAGEESKTPPVSDVEPAEADSKGNCKEKSERSPNSEDDGRGGLNPFLTDAFPYDGPPQPFLTDFSKILH